MSGFPSNWITMSVPPALSIERIYKDSMSRWSWLSNLADGIEYS